MPFIEEYEIADMLGTMFLDQATPNYVDVELAELLQRSISLLQCTEYNSQFHRFYKAATGYLERVMSELAQHALNTFLLTV